MLVPAAQQVLRPVVSVGVLPRFDGVADGLDVSDHLVADDLGEPLDGLRVVGAKVMFPAVVAAVMETARLVAADLRASKHDTRILKRPKGPEKRPSTVFRPSEFVHKSLIYTHLQWAIQDLNL